MNSSDAFAGLEPFLAELKSAAPTPGGGAVAGLLGALAAALAHMVSSLTVGKKKYLSVQGEFETAMPDMAHALTRFQSLMQDDVAVFKTYMAALKLPKATPEDQEARQQAMRMAAIEAARVPMETLELARTILPLVRLAAEKGNKNAISDAGIAAILLSSAAKSAALNVRINLGALAESEAAPQLAKLEDLLSQTLTEAHHIEQLVSSRL